MKYKILITDFDDTLLDDNHEVSNDNLRSIDKFASEGGIFAINTGRMTASILPIAKKFALTGLLGAYQGGVAYDLDKNVIVRDCRMKNSLTVSQLEILEQYGEEVHLYDGDNLYVEKRFGYIDMYEKISGVKATITNQKLAAYAKYNNISANKLMLISDAKKVADVKLSLEKSKHKDISYVLSKPNFLEVIDINGQKGAFARYVSQKHNIPISQIICVGDSLNDLDMIETAGLGIAVANAHDILKDASDIVLPVTNNEHAISYIINNIIFKGER